MNERQRNKARNVGYFGAFAFLALFIAGEGISPSAEDQQTSAACVDGPTTMTPTLDIVSAPYCHKHNPVEQESQSKLVLEGIGGTLGAAYLGRKLTEFVIYHSDSANKKAEDRGAIAPALPQRKSSQSSFMAKPFNPNHVLDEQDPEIISDLAVLLQLEQQSGETES